MNVLTDNDNRAYKDIAFVAKGCNLKQAAANSVAFKFNTKARLSVQSIIDEVMINPLLSVIYNLLSVTIQHWIIMTHNSLSHTSIAL